MRPVDHEALLRHFFTAWNRHDADELAAFYAAEAVMEDPALDGPLVGKPAIRQYCADQFAAAPAARHGLLASATAGDRIFFEWWWSLGPTTDQVLQVRGVSIFTFEQRKIVHDVAYWDTASLAPLRGQQPPRPA